MTTAPVHQVSAVLLDIDGTMAIGANAHHACMSQAAARHGFQLDFTHDGETVSINGRPVTGWLDAQCFRWAAGRALDDTELASIMSAYGDHYERLPDQSCGRLIPGTDEVLRRLHGAGIALALTTGNAHRIARRKLTALGIADFFVFDPDLGFGDRHADRASMVRAALPIGHRPPQAAVVGDTVHDMSAAASLGAIGIGVLTGAADEATLREAGATYVLSSIADLPSLLGLPGEESAPA